ncbi:MAG: HAD hydrolase-like protein [Planctomycetes bacterium]|nr:HAD hydrolase-like protein [Planctomycetota bacterium]
MPAPPPFLFDLDGTLADTLADLTASTNHVRARRDLPPLDAAAVRSFVGDGARALLRRALAPVLPADTAAAEADLDAAFADYCAHHDRQCTVHARPFPGVRAHLEQLAARGHRLAVVTNKPSRFAVPIVRHLRLDDLLPVVVGGDTLAEKKPAPAPLWFALERLGAPRTAGTMVGDGLPDLRAARAAGLGAIACLFGYGDPAALRREGADAYWRAFGVPADQHG